MGPVILFSLVTRSSQSRRSNNTSMGLKQASFVERLSLSRRVPYQRFRCRYGNYSSCVFSEASSVNVAVVNAAVQAESNGNRSTTTHPVVSLEQPDGSRKC